MTCSGASVGGQHEGPSVAAAPGLDKPGLADFAQRLAGGDKRNPEPLGELGLGGQALAGLEDAQEYGVGEPLRHLRGACRRAQGREHGAARPSAVGCVLGHGSNSIRWHPEPVAETESFSAGDGRNP